MDDKNTLPDRPDKAPEKAPRTVKLAVAYPRDVFRSGGHEVTRQPKEFDAATAAKLHDAAKRLGVRLKEVK